MPTDLASLFDLVTTGGALFILVWMVQLLLTEKVVPKGRLDDQKTLTKEALDGWRAANTANERLADAWEARNSAETRMLDARIK